MFASIQSLPVIYRDEYLVVVNKPAGLLSVPGLGAGNQDCVSARVQRSLPDALVVHRLDCHTSGLMVMAVGKSMQASLSRLFHDRAVDKRYVALVDGRVDNTQGLVDVPIRLDPENRPHQVIDYIHGKPSQTYWQVIERVDCNRSPVTRLLLKPHTGRTHQLRVHCMAIGHAILGDALYADQRVIALSDRLMLHAETLTFRHPVNGAMLRLEAPCDF